MSPNSIQYSRYRIYLVVRNLSLAFVWGLYAMKVTVLCSVQNVGRTVTQKSRSELKRGFEELLHPYKFIIILIWKVKSDVHCTLLRLHKDTGFHIQYIFYVIQYIVSLRTCPNMNEPQHCLFNLTEWKRSAFFIHSFLAFKLEGTRDVSLSFTHRIKLLTLVVLLLWQSPHSLLMPNIDLSWSCNPSLGWESAASCKCSCFTSPVITAVKLKPPNTLH